METAESNAVPTRETLIAELNAKLLREQNLPLGIVAGAGAALAGALIWMGITIATQMQLGLVAIAIGAGVGYAVRYAGKGVTKIFGVVGAVLTLLSCVAGEIFTVVESVASSTGDTFVHVLTQVDLSVITNNLVAQSGVMTYVIYGIGIYEGFKFSFRKLTPLEIQEAGLAPTPTAAIDTLKSSS